MYWHLQMQGQLQEQGLIDAIALWGIAHMSIVKIENVRVLDPIQKLIWLKRFY